MMVLKINVIILLSWWFWNCL